MLPKDMKVSELLEDYLSKNNLYYTEVGFENNVYTKKGGSLVDQDKTLGELEAPRSLYLIHEKLDSAITITLVYAEDEYHFMNTNSYNYELLEGKVVITVLKSYTPDDLTKLYYHYGYNNAIKLKFTYGDGSKTIGETETLEDAGIKEGDSITVVEYESED